MPTANARPARARASNEIPASERPSLAKRWAARLVRSAQAEIPSASTVTRAQAETIETATGFQWCAQTKAAPSNAAEASPSAQPAHPRAPDCSIVTSSSIAETLRTVCRKVCKDAPLAAQTGHSTQGESMIVTALSRRGGRRVLLGITL